MADQVLEEICRAKDPGDVQAHSLRRWQQYLREEIQPKLDRLAALEAAQDAGLAKRGRA